MGYTGGSLAELVPDEQWIIDDAVRTARRVGRRLLELVERYTPVAEPDPRDDRGGRVPGTLRRSWRLGEPVILPGGRVRIEVFTRDRIAPHVEYPTRPHIIRPRRARALRFFADGQMVFAMQVQHPGTRGSFMMARAMAQVAVEWRGIARRELGASRGSVELR